MYIKNRLADGVYRRYLMSAIAFYPYFIWQNGYIIKSYACMWLSFFNGTSATLFCPFSCFFFLLDIVYIKARRHTIFDYIKLVFEKYYGLVYGKIIKYNTFLCVLFTRYNHRTDFFFKRRFNNKKIDAY